jgi:hypothetical protein
VFRATVSHVVPDVIKGIVLDRGLLLMNKLLTQVYMIERTVHAGTVVVALMN